MKQGVSELTYLRLLIFSSPTENFSPESVRDLLDEQARNQAQTPSIYREGIDVTQRCC